MPQRSIYFEFSVAGAFVKVSAIDGTTGEEVCIVAPRNTPQNDLEDLARRKLEFVQGKMHARKPKSAQTKQGLWV